MSKRTNSIFIFSVIGLLKFSCFLYLFCLSGFFFSKSDGIFHLKGIKLSKLKRRVVTLHNLGDSLAGVYLAGIQKNGSFDTEAAGIGIEEVNISEFILKLSDEISSTDAGKLAKVIAEECESYGVDPLLVLAVIQVESEFSPMAVSHKGAVGLMQVMPTTARFVAKKFGIALNGNQSLHDPFLNVRLGIYYLSMLTERFNSIERVLAAYNFGPNRSFLSEKNLEKSPPAYVRKVLSFRSWLENERKIIAKKS